MRIESVADENPEPVEEFSIILKKVDKFGKIDENSYNSTIIIESNDKAVYIKGLRIFSFSYQIQHVEIRNNLPEY